MQQREYYYQDFGHLTQYNQFLKGFEDGNFMWNFYTFTRPNREQLRPSGRNRTYSRAILVQRSNQMSYRKTVVVLMHTHLPMACQT
jgi:hypothetical protein